MDTCVHFLFFLLAILNSDVLSQNLDGAWSSWSDCDLECDGGLKTRYCVWDSYKPPKHPTCSKEGIEAESCNKISCETRKPLNDKGLTQWTAWAISKEVPGDLVRYRECKHEHLGCEGYLDEAISISDVVSSSSKRIRVPKKDGKKSGDFSRTDEGGGDGDAEGTTEPPKPPPEWIIVKEEGGYNIEEYVGKGEYVREVAEDWNAWTSWKRSPEGMQESTRTCKNAPKGPCRGQGRRQKRKKPKVFIREGSYDIEVAESKVVEVVEDWEEYGKWIVQNDGTYIRIRKCKNPKGPCRGSSTQKARKAPPSPKEKGKKGEENEYDYEDELSYKSSRSLKGKRGKKHQKKATPSNKINITAILTTVKPTKPPTKPSTKPLSKILTKPPTKPPSKPLTKPPTKLLTKPPTKPLTKPPTKLLTKPPTKPLTKPPSKPLTKPPTKPPSKILTKPPTKPPSKILTKPPTKPLTKPPTKPPIKPLTKKPSRPPTTIRVIVQPPTTVAPIRPRLEPPKKPPTTAAPIEPLTTTEPTEPPTTIEAIVPSTTELTEPPTTVKPITKPPVMTLPPVAPPLPVIQPIIIPVICSGLNLPCNKEPEPKVPLPCEMDTGCAIKQTKSKAVVLHSELILAAEEKEDCSDDIYFDKLSLASWINSLKPTSRLRNKGFELPPGLTLIPTKLLKILMECECLRSQWERYDASRSSDFFYDFYGSRRPPFGRMRGRVGRERGNRGMPRRRRPEYDEDNGYDDRDYERPQKKQNSVSDGKKVIIIT